MQTTADNLTISLRHPGWRTHAGICLLGQPFEDEQLLDPVTLHELIQRLLIAKQPDKDLLRATLHKLRGLYAIVCLAGDFLLVAADVVRTFPLFLTTSRSRVYVSDHLPTKGLSEQRLIATNILEFALTGFVSGGDTLYEGVRQVQAGEALLVHIPSSIATTILHTCFAPTHPPLLAQIHSIEEFIEQIDNALSRAAKRLIRYLNGRTAVLPLSGGWDSRTILLQLKRHGYPDIVAFTYGTPRNSEARVSEEVARRMNVRWHFVPYTTDAWRDLAKSGQYRKYLWYAHNGVSTPHIQDLLALDRLCRSSTLRPSECVLLPGHSADFLAGSHLRADNEFISSRKAILDALWAKHYVLVDPQFACDYMQAALAGPNWRAQLSELRMRLELQVAKYWRQLALSDVHAFLDFWNWRERQAKFIVNAVRAYEFYNLDFWLPLWDADFVKVWEGVPVQWRLGRKLYAAYLDYLQKIAGLCMPVITPRPRLKTCLTKLLKSMNLYSTSITLRNRLASHRPKHVYNSHFLQWYGIWPSDAFSAFIRKNKGSFNINSLVAFDVLSGIHCLQNRALQDRKPGQMYFA
jgi:asparagine synthase (glutamine-hydrolysing)